MLSRVQIGALWRRVRRDARRRRPPHCPDGWSTARPDFVGLGAQRAGTTWWYDLIASHPRVVHRGALKELHYLRQFWDRPFTEADAESYARHFPRPAGHLSGEWSPGYLSYFWVPPILARAVPSARLLVLLRDPVERYRSGQALQSQTRRPSFSGAATAFRLGCYASQLEHLYSYVDPSRVLVLQFERCIRDPGPELARTYRFLGLDDAFVPSDLTRPRNETRGTKPGLDPELRDALVRAYEPEVRRLVPLAPDLDMGEWPNFGHVSQR